MLFRSPAGKVIGGDEVGEVLTQLVVALALEPLDGGILDGAVHALDLGVGPRVACLGEISSAFLRAVGARPGISQPPWPWRCPGG